MLSRSAASLLAIVMLHGQASAQPESNRETAVQLNAGFGQSDNILREPAAGERAAFHWLGMRLDMATERRRLSGDVVGDLQLRRYDSAAPLVDDDELLGSVDGRAAFALVPERFSWNFGASAGQTRTNPLEAPSPGNREEVRIFSTGPSLSLPVGPAMLLRMSATRSDRSFEESDQLDSDSEQITLALDRALSTVSRGALLLARNEVDYADVDAAYVLRSLYLTYTREFSSGGVELRIGATEASSSVLDGDTTPVTSVRWSRGVGARSELSLWASKELTDPGELFRGSGIPGLVGDGRQGALEEIAVNDARLDGVVLGQEALERSTAGVALRVSGSRSTLGVTLSVADEEFQAGSVPSGSEFLSNDNRSVQVSYSRELNRRWDGSVSIRAVDRDFGVAERSNDDRRSRVTLRRTLAGRANVELLFERNVRGGDLGASDENVYAISMSYDFDP